MHLNGALKTQCFVQLRLMRFGSTLCSWAPLHPAPNYLPLCIQNRLGDGSRRDPGSPWWVSLSRPETRGRVASHSRHKLHRFGAKKVTELKDLPVEINIQTGLGIKSR